MQNAVSDHADELASWGLGEYGEGTPQYDVKYTHSSSPSQYEPVVKYGPQPSSPYAEKYVKRADEPVSTSHEANLTKSNPIYKLISYQVTLVPRSNWENLKNPRIFF